MISSRFFRKAIGGAAFIALLAFGLAACSDAVSFSDATEAPKAGTNYKIASYTYDSKGARVISLTDTFRAVVLPTLPLHAGRTSVVPFALNTWRDTMYLRYEPNGNVSLLWSGLSVDRPGGGSDFRIPDTWIPLPLGGKTIGVHTLLDTAYTYQAGSTPIPAAVNLKVITQFLGPDPVLTENGLLNTMKVEVKQELTMTQGTSTGKEVFAHTIWYSPKLGGLVQQDILELRGNATGSLDQIRHNGWAIQSYVLVK